MKIYVVGNLLVGMDSLPIRLLPQLKKTFPKIEFIEFDPTEDFKPENKGLTIIDTIINAKDVCLIEDIDRIIVENICSLHDFDLGYNLKLMKKFGLIEKVKIVGLPPEIEEKEAIEKIGKIIASLS